MESYSIYLICVVESKVLGEEAMKSMSPVNRVKQHKDRITGEPFVHYRWYYKLGLLYSI